MLGISQSSSDISFVIKDFGVNVDGRFGDVDIEATFNSENELTKIYGNIKVNSIDTGIESRDEHLLKEDYFNTKKYPYIALSSQKISKIDSTHYSVKVSLNIKGTTKTFSIPVQVIVKNNKATITSSFEINRKNFNVGAGSLVMSKTVKIKVNHSQKI